MAKAFICVLKQNSHYFSSPLKKTRRARITFTRIPPPYTKHAITSDTAQGFSKLVSLQKVQAFLFLLLHTKAPLLCCGVALDPQMGSATNTKTSACLAPQSHSDMMVCEWCGDGICICLCHMRYFEKRKRFLLIKTWIAKKSWLWNSVFCHERCSPLMHDASWSGKYYYD